MQEHALGHIAEGPLGGCHFPLGRSQGELCRVGLRGHCLEGLFGTSLPWPVLVKKGGLGPPSSCCSCQSATKRVHIGPLCWNECGCIANPTRGALGRVAGLVKYAH